MTSKVSICSNASVMLGAKTIADFSEDNDRTRIFANLYPSVRDATLRAHPWNCLMKRIVLNPRTTNPPAFGYTNAFDLPGDCLRVWSIGYNGDGIDYQLEGRTIYSDETTISLRYVSSDVDEALWDSLLIHAMTLYMAQAAAFAITGSASAGEGFKDLMRQAMQQARAVDAQENPPEALDALPRFVRARV